ncbi:hypothetical protein BST61_g2127 [Cercospora zeina]
MPSLPTTPTHSVSEGAVPTKPHGSSCWNLACDRSWSEFSPSSTTPDLTQSPSVRLHLLVNELRTSLEFTAAYEACNFVSKWEKADSEFQEANRAESLGLRDAIGDEYCKTHTAQQN